MTTTVAPLSYAQLKERLSLDIAENLETELEEGAVLLQMVAEETARLGKLMFDKKVELKATEALVLLAVRQDPDKAKVTVDEKKALVDSHQSVVDARYALGAAEELYEQWHGLRFSFRERQESLRSTVQCIITGYIAHAKATVYEVEGVTEY